MSDEAMMREVRRIVAKAKRLKPAGPRRETGSVHESAVRKDGPKTSKGKGQ